MAKFCAALAAISLLLAACAPQPGVSPVSPAEILPAETEPSYPPPSTTVDVSTSQGYPEPAATEPPAQAPGEPSPTPDLLTYQRSASQMISPNGRYAARIVIALPQLPDGTLVGDTYHVQASLVDFQDGSQQVALDEWRNWGMGYTTPQVLGWTADSRAYYLVDSGVPDGCGPAFYEKVRKVEAGNNQITTVVEHPGSAPALSPQGDRLAAIGQAQVLVYDLASGEQATYPFEAPGAEFWPGEITWSPDGQRLLFLGLNDPCELEGETSSTLYLVDLAKNSAGNLLEAGSTRLIPLSWPLEDVVQLRDPQGQDYWLQVSNGSLSQEPPAEIASASQALTGYFAALHEGRYADAAELYGGSYEQLQANNPEVDPQDQASLLEKACTQNGFQCLPVRNATLIDQPGEGAYRFLVVFEQDGQDFVLGPCCGADIAEMPPMSEFPYTVKQAEDGNYRVQELPVYVP